MKLALNFTLIVFFEPWFVVSPCMFLKFVFKKLKVAFVFEIAGKKKKFRQEYKKKLRKYFQSSRFPHILWKIHTNPSRALRKS